MLSFAATRAVLDSTVLGVGAVIIVIQENQRSVDHMVVKVKAWFSQSPKVKKEADVT